MQQRRGQSSNKLSAADRREQLLGVAREIVADKGIDTLTMERVAARAEVSKALVYLHFSNSTDILAALLHAEWEYIDREVAAAMAGAHNFDDKVLANLLPYLKGPSDRGHIFRTLVLERTTQQVVQEMQTGRRQAVVAFWAAAIAEEYGLGPREAGPMAVMLVSAFDGVAHFYWTAGEADQQRVLSLYMTLVKAALFEISRARIGAGKGS